mgnify:CR=1 FL=1
MNRLPHSAYHPHAFREVCLPSGKILGVWADPLLELVTKGDWRATCTFGRPAPLDDFLVVLSRTGNGWATTGVTLAWIGELALQPHDQHAFDEWLALAPTAAWLAEIQQLTESAVATLQRTAVSALLQAIQQPPNIQLSDEVTS